MKWESDSEVNAIYIYRYDTSSNAIIVIIIMISTEDDYNDMRDNARTILIGNLQLSMLI